MLRAAAQAGFLLAFFAAILFASSARLDWPAAWAFLAVWAGSTVLGFLLIDPELIKARSELAGPDSPWWDKVMAPLMFLWLMPVPLVVAGLDERYGWSPDLPLAIRIVAFVVFCLGLAFAFWAERTNRFFTTWVRIQHERGHHVVSSGPYAFVRHPGYAGSIVLFVALPVELGSLFAVLAAAVGAALVAARTALEDRVLQSDLDGYRDYSVRVRWRLVPGVW